MEQILQDLKTGKVDLINSPVPQVKANHLLIQTSVSLLSSGTERMLLNFGKAGIIGKIRQQPDKVKEVIQKAKTEGIATTIDAVKSKLDQPLPLGYCNVGRVLAIGKGVSGYEVGDRVLSNGAHAEVVHIGKNLCVKIPDSVSDEEAVFGVLGSIGLEGIRLAAPTLGETFVVIGLGLVGLLTAQLLKAHGCRVLGVEFDASRCALAKTFGITTVNPAQGEDPVSVAENFSRGNGIDGVLITASTQSNEPVHQAATMCRKRGRIVLVGVTGLELSRADFYEKELSFQVSCSYGPGRYDVDYEEKGHDYPFGFVRWTEQRNMTAVLDMMAQGQCDVKSLITHRLDFENAPDAYNLLEDRSALGIVLQYPNKLVSQETTVSLKNETTSTSQKVSIACLGAGNYASRMLIPAFKATNTKLHTLISGQGLTSSIVGRKSGFNYASTDYQSVLNNTEINTVVIATRHDLHAEQTIQALKADKHVFVEKPLAISSEQLTTIKNCYQELSETDKQAPKLMLGFNRRFSPHVKKIAELLTPLHAPKNMVMTVNAGFIPKDHWTQDADVGGGRLLGEACHFVDLLRFLAGSTIIDARCANLSAEKSHMEEDENITITLRFADGSQGTVHYFSNGHKAFPKERLEVFCDGKIIQLDNFRKMKAYGFKGFSKMNLMRQDKGQSNCVKAFVDAVDKGTPSPISLTEIIEVTEVCLELREKLKGKQQ
jgi:predicted dehydrogenase/threonine dehydrogenase-like Zn-dependent dehydrogenase